MDEILAQLNRVRGVGGSLLVSADGLAMATALRQDTDETRLSASVGAVLESINRLADALGLGRSSAFNAVSDQGGLLLLAAGPSAYLVIVVDPSANFALMQLESRPFIDRIARRLAL